jgi:glycosyltransferase involved in cell wall biosynthesis
MSENPKRTVCFFNTNRAWGGGEKWHFTTAQEFERRGFKSLLVTNVHSELSKKASAAKLNYFSFYVHNLSFLNPFKILTMVSFFKSQRVDTVIMNLPSDLKLAGIAARLAGVKRIIYRRGMPHPLRDTALNRFLFRRILTHVVVNSEEIGRSLAAPNEAWFPKEKLLLVYNGVESSKDPASPAKLYERRGDEVILGNAGRLTEQKGQKYLLEMAEKLKEDGVKFKLLIAGDGELRQELKRAITELDLEDEVTILGHVDDMPAFMNSIDIFVFPSLFEGSANTLIEALHFGKPSVAFNVSSNPEIIQHGQNGYLARAFEVDDLTDCVEALINSPERRKEFGRQGVETVKQKFDAARNLDKLQAMIERN